MTDLEAPFPWFGGKSRVADVVWPALGDVGHYIEPFAGSLAVLLARPDTHTGYIETVNDIDGYIANFWRALQAAPDDVAQYADWPVNENDLTARHIWLVNEGRERVAKLEGDADYYDAKVAGWWVWGICCWIGSNWCAGDGPWKTIGGMAVKQKSASGTGVNRKRPHLGNPGMGVNRQLPHLGNGRGVNRKLPHLGDLGKGVNRPKRDLRVWMRALSDRLRRVRVCCGDWSRIVTDGAMAHGNTVGVFLDPPYDTAIRCDGCYNTDGEHGHISADVRAWCLERGDDPRMRIALCGYEGEHDMPESWRVHEWASGACYSTAAAAIRQDGAHANRHKERIWFSPHCLHECEPVLWGQP